MDVKDVKDLWREIGIAEPSGPLEVPLRFRADEALVESLDKLHASFKNAGYRVSRSEILRSLIATALEGVRETYPLDDVQLTARTKQ